MHTETAQILLNDYADYQRGKGLAAATIRNHQSILSTLERFIGEPLETLTVIQLRRFVGRDDTHDGQRIKLSTRRTNRAVLVAFYRYLEEEGLREDNPTRRLMPVKVPRADPRPFSREQVDRMLESGCYTRTRAMILLGYYQGFRRSMIARVRGEDIDLDAMTINVVAKGGKLRTLPLHPVIAELAETLPRSGWWFPARKSPTGHIHPESVSDLIRKAKQRAGITNERLTPHSLRHGFATDLIEEGVDVRVVQELMLHESLSTTQIYTRVSERRKRDGITALPGRVIPIRSGRHRRDEMPFAA